MISTLRDEDGGLYNVEYIIKDNKLFALWEGDAEPYQVDLSIDTIDVRMNDHPQNI